MPFQQKVIIWSLKELKLETIIDYHNYRHPLQEDKKSQTNGRPAQTKTHQPQVRKTLIFSRWCAGPILAFCPGPLSLPILSISSAIQQITSRSIRWQYQLGAPAVSTNSGGNCLLDRALKWQWVWHPSGFLGWCAIWCALFCWKNFSQSLFFFFLLLAPRIGYSTGILLVLLSFGLPAFLEYMLLAGWWGERKENLFKNHLSGGEPGTSQKTTWLGSGVCVPHWKTQRSILSAVGYSEILWLAAVWSRATRGFIPGLPHPSNRSWEP